MKNSATTHRPHFLRSRLGRVCVAITGATSEEMIERAEAVVRENPFVEFRLDYLPKPLAGLPKLGEFLGDHREVTAIATCRREVCGGKFKGAVAAELEVLNKAAAAGFQLVDVALETAEAVKEAELDKLRAKGVALIISHHDFVSTRDLDGMFERIQPYDPDFVKIVTTAKSLADNVTMIRFLERTRDHASVVGVCMGEYGIISRVLGVRAGSAFSFAAATAGEETAPGQIAARTLIETYRIDQVDAATKVYGVAGNPVKQSLSPLMMNSAFRRETVNAVFLALQTNKLADLLTLVREIPISGMSVTMPLKQEILKHLDRTDAISAKVGACNTIVRAQDGKLIGFNTDVAGVVRPLEQRLDVKKAKILVVGAGGAARAAVFGLRDKGADVYVVNRTLPTGQKLAKDAGAKSIKRELLAKTSFDVIINATSVGMSGTKLAKGQEATVLTEKELNARVVFDLVYSPMETPLLKLARQKGLVAITGAEMFVHQGAEQFQLWTGKPAPKEEMWRVVTHALQQRAEAAAAESAGK